MLARCSACNTPLRVRPETLRALPALQPAPSFVVLANSRQVDRFVLPFCEVPAWVQEPSHVQPCLAEVLVSYGQSMTSCWHLYQPLLGDPLASCYHGITSFKLSCYLELIVSCLSLRCLCHPVNKGQVSGSCWFIGEVQDF